VTTQKRRKARFKMEMFASDEGARRWVLTSVIFFALLHGCAPPPVESERGNANTVKTTPSTQTKTPRSSPPSWQEYTTWTRVRIKAQAPTGPGLSALETCFILTVREIAHGFGAFARGAADIYEGTDFDHDCIMVLWGADNQDGTVVREKWRNQNTGRMVVVTDGTSAVREVKSITGSGALVRISKDYAPDQVMIVWGTNSSQYGFRKPVIIDRPGSFFRERLEEAQRHPEERYLPIEYRRGTD